MDFSKLIVDRYSVRAYKPDEIEEEKLNQVLEAARMAPTAANRQPFKLLVIKTEGRQEELKRIYNSDWFVQPPLVICACGLDAEAWQRKDDDQAYTMVDVAIVMDHLILAAAELGLGTCWIAAFDPVAAREVLDLPAEYTPIVFTPLGYPDSTPRAKRRKDLTDLVEYR